MTVIDNASYGLKMQGVSKKERYEIAGEHLSKMGLEGFEKAYPHQLSGV